MTRTTALDVIGARLEEDVVSDFLGAAAISRVGDSTVSAALRRVPGLTLVNDQFPKDEPHGWKFIAIGPDEKLYVPVGAPGAQIPEWVHPTVEGYQASADALLAAID